MTAAYPATQPTMVVPRFIECGESLSAQISAGPCLECLDAAAEVLLAYRTRLSQADVAHGICWACLPVVLDDTDRFDLALPVVVRARDV